MTDEKKQGPPVSFRPWKKHSDGMEANEDWFQTFKRGVMFKQVFKNSVSTFFNFLMLTYRGQGAEQSIEEIKTHDGDDNE